MWSQHMPLPAVSRHVRFFTVCMPKKGPWRIIVPRFRNFSKLVDNIYPTELSKPEDGARTDRHRIARSAHETARRNGKASEERETDSTKRASLLLVQRYRPWNSIKVVGLGGEPPTVLCASLDKPKFAWPNSTPLLIDCDE